MADARTHTNKRNDGVESYLDVLSTASSMALCFVCLVRSAYKCPSCTCGPCFVDMDNTELESPMTCIRRGMKCASTNWLNIQGGDIKDA